MSDPGAQLTADIAKLVAMIEQAAMELDLAEEPASFTIALQTGGDDD